MKWFDTSCFARHSPCVKYELHILRARHPSRRNLTISPQDERKDAFTPELAEGSLERRLGVARRAYRRISKKKGKL